MSLQNWSLNSNSQGTKMCLAGIMACMLLLVALPVFFAIVLSKIAYGLALMIILLTIAGIWFYYTSQEKK